MKLIKENYKILMIVSLILNYTDNISICIKIMKMISEYLWIMHLKFRMINNLNYNHLNSRLNLLTKNFKNI